MTGRNGYLDGSECRRKKKGLEGGVPPSSSHPQSIGRKASAKKEEAVVEVWNSHGGNLRKMQTQDTLETAEQC